MVNREELGATFFDRLLDNLTGWSLRPWVGIVAFYSVLKQSGAEAICKAIQPVIYEAHNRRVIILHAILGH